MKKLYKIGIVIVLISFFVVGCKKNNNEIENYTKTKNSIEKVTIDSLTLKKELFSALDYFQKESCSGDFETKMKGYLNYKGIRSDCNFNETKKYFNDIKDLSNEELLKYLYENHYISQTSYLILEKYSADTSLSQNFTNKIEKYSEMINNNPLINKEEKNKILLGLQITKYLNEYFETNATKGKCSRCIRQNSGSIFFHTGLSMIVPTIACLLVGDPVAIAGCIAGVASITVYFNICAYCRTNCFFCI